MDKLARKQQEEQLFERLAKAMQEASTQIRQGFQQLMEANEDPREQVKIGARHTIERLGDLRKRELLQSVKFNNFALRLRQLRERLAYQAIALTLKDRVLSGRRGAGWNGRGLEFLGPAPAPAPLLAAQVGRNREEPGGDRAARGVGLPCSVDTHPERLKKLLRRGTVDHPSDKAEEPVAPSLVDLLEGSDVSSMGVRLHQRLVGGRRLRVFPSGQFAHPASSTVDMPAGRNRCVPLDMPA
jgi:hypothetical protein